MAELPEPLAGLVRDHREIEEVVASAHKAISAAAGKPTDEAIVSAALEELRDLEAFAAVDLTVHIDKEERFFFPALLEAVKAETELVIDDMLAQHDEVRDRNAEVQAVLDAIDNHHDEVSSETANLSSGLRAAEALLTPEVLNQLYDSVKKLDWILQGHFLDEEDSLFEPSVNWFSAEKFAEMSEQMAALEDSIGM